MTLKKKYMTLKLFQIYYMTYKKIYMTFKIKRHMHARVIFRCCALLNSFSRLSSAVPLLFAPTNRMQYSGEDRSRSGSSDQVGSFHDVGLAVATTAGAFRKTPLDSSEFSNSLGMIFLRQTIPLSASPPSSHVRIVSASGLASHASWTPRTCMPCDIVIDAS